MKTSFFIVLIAISGIVMSCDKDDDMQQEPTIAGTWNLLNIQGGFAGIDADFSPGLITWNFNAETSSLSVVNNHPEDEIVYDGFETGTYPYSILQSEGDKLLSIDGGTFGIYTFTDYQLIIDQNIASDGYVFSFER